LVFTQIHSGQAALGSQEPSSPPSAQVTRKVLVVLAEFADEPHDQKHTREYFENLIFGDGISLRRFVEENSLGRVTIKGDVWDWVRIRNRLEYTDDLCFLKGAGLDLSDRVDVTLGRRQVSKLATHAIHEAVRSYNIDLNRYDGDGDGWVDHAIIVHSGDDQANRGYCGEIDEAEADSLYWSRAVQTEYFKTRGGLTRITSGIVSEDDTLMAIAHEFFHTFDLPDLYRDNVPLCWSLMGGPCSLVHLDPWSKMKIGFLGKDDMRSIDKTERGIRLLGSAASEQGKRLVKIPTGPGVYYLLEYRQRTPFDELPTGQQAIVVWRINDPLALLSPPNGVLEKGQILSKDSLTFHDRGKTIMITLTDFSASYATLDIIISSEPFFAVTFRPSTKAVYSPGEDVDLEVQVVNFGGKIGSFYLGVSLQDPKGHTIDLPLPDQATLRPLEEKTFRFTYKLGPNTEPGVYRVTANLWKDKSLIDRYEDDTEDWRELFIVGQVSVQILLPTNKMPAFAGTKETPTPFNAQVSWTVNGQMLVTDLLQPSPPFGYSAVVGGILSEVRAYGQLAVGRYSAIIGPPRKEPGLYDLELRFSPKYYVWVKEDSDYVLKPIVRDPQFVAVAEKSVKYVAEGETSAPLNVILVLDRSGSMTGDKIAKAKEASKLVIDIMKIGDSIGLVSFSHNIVLNYPLTRVTDHKVKEELKKAVDSLVAEGNTNIGGGLNETIQELAKVGYASAVAVLLSDGQHNTGTHPDQVLPLLTQKGIVVHAIALGSDADQGLMAKIGRETGGVYLFSPTPEELLSVFFTTVSVSKHHQTLLVSRYALRAQQPERAQILVDEASELNILTVWNKGKVAVNLIDPDGNDVNRTAGNVRVAQSEFYELWTIEKPRLGVWMMDLHASEDTDLKVEVTAFSTNSLVAFSDKNTYYSGEPIKVTATFASAAPSANLSLVGVYALYDGANREVANGTLYDDGLHGDGLASDGVYSDYIAKELPTGSYTLRVVGLFGHPGFETITPSFTRIATSSIFIVPKVVPPVTVTPEQLTINLQQYDHKTTILSISSKAAESTPVTLLIYAPKDATGGPVSGMVLRLDRSFMTVMPNSSEEVQLSVLAEGTAVGTYGGKIMLVTPNYTIPINVVLRVAAVRLDVVPSVIEITSQQAASKNFSFQVRLIQGALENASLRALGEAGNWTRLTLGRVRMMEGEEKTIEGVLTVPQMIPLGNYSGHIEIRVGDIRITSVPFLVKVEEPALPLVVSPAPPSYLPIAIVLLISATIATAVAYSIAHRPRCPRCGTVADSRRASFCRKCGLKMR
jgi:M6 family metalloprotease-like protein